MYTYIFLKIIALIIALIALIYLLRIHHGFSWIKKIYGRVSKKSWLGISGLVLAAILGIISTYSYPLHFAMPPTMHSEAPGHLPASIPIPKIAEFFFSKDMEKVNDIGADPTDIPPPITRKKNTTVHINLVAQEVLAEVADGITFNYWTYNKQVPGPFFRVKQGDTVEVNITNHVSSLHPHNIDFHAVTGPGGGAVVTKVQPGETKSFTWKALNPGLYVYHCATANVSTHNAHGQYGLILVEPKKGLPPVDHEFYIMQGELYTVGDIGKKGLVAFDSKKLLDGIPTYITFNGRIETEPRMKIKTGDTVRIYVGNGGLNLVSSFHIIGEIFDTVYPEAAIGSAPHKNIQTTAVLPGGATIVEFTAEVPGDYTLVDHALARMNKGAWSVLQVEGEQNRTIFDSPELKITKPTLTHSSYE